jgi:hypothetical protein
MKAFRLSCADKSFVRIEPNSLRIGVRGYAELEQRGPITQRGLRVKVLDAAVSDRQRTRRELLFVFEEPEVVANLRLVELIGRRPKMDRDLPHGP